jgi:hypothetical protein
VVVGAALWSIAWYAFTQGLVHGAGRPAQILGASMSVWIVTALVVVWAAIGKGRTPAGRPRAQLVAIALGAPILILAVMAALGRLMLADEAQLVASLLRPSSHCFAMTLAAALPPLVAMLYVRRNSDPVHALAHGAALAVAFGVYAGVMVCAWCPDVSIRHIALGHVAPLLLLAIVGAVLGRKFLVLPCS